MSWTPPGGGAPVGPPASPEPVPSTQLPAAPPPAVASSTPALAQAPAAQPAGKGYAVPVIVAVIGALVAGSLIGGIGTGISMANGPTYPTDPYEPYPADPPAQSGGDYSDLAEGDPGPSTAVEPTVCNTTCFGELAAERAILDDEVFADELLPTFKHVWEMTGDRTTADFALPIARGDWVYRGYTPDECFVTWSESPLVEPLGVSAGHDFVAPLTEHTSDQFPQTVLTQSVRVFPDSASADEYMAIVDAGLDECTRYHDPNGYAIDTITREPMLHQPDNVAAVGFVRSLRGIRYYVFDLQRGNMVIRSVAYSDGGIDDTGFRVLMVQQAEVLGNLPPG